MVETTGLEAPEALAGRCCSRSSLGGTGGSEAWGVRDMGEGGRSTCKHTRIQTQTDTRY